MKLTTHAGLTSNQICPKGRNRYQQEQEAKRRLYQSTMGLPYRPMRKSGCVS